MKFELIIADEAFENIKTASDYYLKISSSLNDRFLAAIFNSLSNIQSSPEHFQKRYRNIRIAHAVNFPFGLHFIIEGKVIKVLKILHHKQFYK